MVTRYLLLLLILSNAVIAKSNDVTDIVIKNYKSGIEVPSNDINVYQRQLITVHIELFTNEEFSYFKSGELQTNDFLIDIGLLKNTDNQKEGMFKKSIRVFIWPLRPGDQSISLPEIKLILSGRIIHEIKLPTLQLNVSKLPDYLPPGFPVGEIDVDSEYNSETIVPFILTPGELANYSIRLYSTGIHPSLIPDYSRYLHNDSVSKLLKSKLTEGFSYDLKYSYTRTQSIPIISKYNGLSRFEEFNILFYEPISQKVNSLIFDSIMLISLNLIFKLIALSIVIYLLYRLIRIMIYCKIFLQLRRRYWKEIYLANDITELSQSLRHLRPIKILNQDVKTSSNISLLKWASLWQNSCLLQEIDTLLEKQFSNASLQGFEKSKHQVISRLKALDCIIFHFYTDKIV